MVVRLVAKLEEMHMHFYQIPSNQVNIKNLEVAKTTSNNVYNICSSMFRPKIIFHVKANIFKG